MPPSPAEGLLLLGGGGHAAVVADAASAAGWRIAGLLDDNPQATIPGSEWLGAIDDLQRTLAARFEHEPVVHAAVGDAALRAAWLDLARSLGLKTPPIVHPAAVVSPSAVIGNGVFIGPNAVVNARARIGEGAIINTAAVVEHDCTIGAFAHVAPRAALGGGVRVGESALIGIGASLRPGVTVGNSAVVGVGAAVVDDVSDNVTVAGVPARVC